MTFQGGEPFDVATSLGFSLYSAHNALSRIYSLVAGQIGLTYPQYLVMSQLWRADGLTVGSIGRSLYLESSTLTPLLKRLEAMAMIKRRRDGRDERQVRVWLTEQGRELSAKGDDIPGLVQQQSGLSYEQARTLAASLREARDRLVRAPVLNGGDAPTLV